jgi:hypothetical protein
MSDTKALIEWARNCDDSEYVEVVPQLVAALEAAEVSEQAAWLTADLKMKQRAEQAEARGDKFRNQVNEQVIRAIKAEAEVARLRAALESIARNTCCDGCGEAAKVARAALAGKPSETQKGQAE